MKMFFDEGASMLRTPYEKELLISSRLHASIKKMGTDVDHDSFREICFREEGRGWLCAKRSLDREYFLMLDNAQMPLSKCQEMSQQFSHVHFTNIYMI